MPTDLIIKVWHSYSRRIKSVYHNWVAQRHIKDSKWTIWWVMVVWRYVYSVSTKLDREKEIWAVFYIFIYTQLNLILSQHALPEKINYLTFLKKDLFTLIYYATQIIYCCLALNSSVKAHEWGSQKEIFKGTSYKYV